MNAIEIIERVREHDAELMLEDQRLVVRGRGDRLPPELKAELKEHRAEVMVALGAPMDVTVASIIAEIRPRLSKNLRDLPDSKLAVLVNFQMMHALARAVAEFRSEDQR